MTSHVYRSLLNSQTNMTGTFSSRFAFGLSWPDVWGGNTLLNFFMLSHYILWHAAACLFDFYCSMDIFRINLKLRGLSKTTKRLNLSFVKHFIWIICVKCIKIYLKFRYIWGNIWELQSRLQAVPSSWSHFDLVILKLNARWFTATWNFSYLVWKLGGICGVGISTVSVN